MFEGQYQLWHRGRCVIFFYWLTPYWPSDLLSEKFRDLLNISLHRERPLGSSIRLMYRLIGVHRQAFIGSCCYQTMAIFFPCGSHESKYLKYCWELNVNMFDTEKVGSLTCMEKKSIELNYSLSFFSLLQVEDVFFTSFY